MWNATKAGKRKSLIPRGLYVGLEPQAACLYRPQKPSWPLDKK
jgi:hypothetical protein